MIQLLCMLFAAVSLFLGWVVFANDKKSAVSRYYFAFSVSSAAWLLCNAITTPGPIKFSFDVQLFFASLISFSSIVSLILLTLFAYEYIGRPAGRLLKAFYVVQIIFLAVTAFTSLNVIGDGGEIKVGSLYLVIVSLQFINLIILLAELFRKSIDASEKTLKSKQFLRRSILLALLPILFFGSVMPLLGYETISNIAPAFSVIFLALYARAILRRELFDVRDTVARATAYVLSLVALVAIYVGVLLIVSDVFGTGTTMDWRARVFYLTVAVLSALTFQPLKRFFDRATSKIFYRDAYDPQQLIDEISNLLVTNYELERLGDLVSSVIVRHMKVEFCSFYVTKASKQHLFGTKKAFAFMKADDITKQMTAKIVIIDDKHAYANQLEKTLKSEVKKTGAHLVAKLETTTESVGAMFLGPKKSGSRISAADIKVIDIIIDEIALAFQNATRFEEISTFNATLQQKIEAATQELTRTNEKLKALDEAKDEFISMASHQLRTPLTSIKGYLSLVLEGDLGEITPQQRQLLGQAFFSSQRMVYLIADLLNVSRLRTGKFLIEPSDVQLADIADEEIKQIEETAKAKKIKVTYKKPKDFPVLKLDDNKIRQVMMNFMDNAIYYTPSGGNIIIELIKKRKSIEFRVTDNGIGVPKAEQHKLFTKFYRANNARSVRPDGTGLGLFMAKKVIVASGGAIIFKSTEGKGSTFGFTFPLD